MSLRKENVTWLIFGLLAGFSVAYLLMQLRQRTPPAQMMIVPPDPTPSPQPTDTPGPIRVYVSGEVAAPAVYELPAGSIAADAVAQAGGATPAGDLNQVNLALPLTDGMQLHIPAVGEAYEPPPVVSVPEPTELQPMAGRDAAAGAQVNINTADAGQLTSLPGIGPSLAQRIIDYRETHGPFDEPADIINVSGIGQVTFEQIKDLITVTE